MSQTRLEFNFETPRLAQDFLRAAVDWDTWYARQEKTWVPMPCGHLGSAEVHMRALEGEGEDHFCGLCYIDVAEDARKFLMSKSTSIGRDGRRLLRALMDARKGLLTRS